MKKGIYLLGLGVLLLLCMDLQAKVRLPHFFSSNMVLQRDMPIRVWGKADKNEVISVALNGSVQTAKTGKDGIWRVELPAMKAGGPYDMQIESAWGSLVSCKSLMFSCGSQPFKSSPPISQCDTFRILLCHSLAFG